jgi:hypothetical protein
MIAFLTGVIRLSCKSIWTILAAVGSRAAVNKIDDFDQRRVAKGPFDKAADYRSDSSEEGALLLIERAEMLPRRAKEILS